MRKTIAIEGRPTVPGQFLEVGTLKWNEGEKYPVCWMADWDKLPIGVASDIRREEDGTITAEINDLEEKYRKLLDHGDISATFYANEVVAKKADEEGDRHYTSCRLRAIYLVVKDQVPW